jgi:hypothetical protein
MKPLAPLFLLASCVSAAEWTGYISDEACGWNNARNTKEAKECARVCVKAGWEPVFVPDGGMDAYKFSDKGKQALPFVGEKVRITGTRKGDVVTVNKIRRVSASATRNSAAPILKIPPP